MPQKLVSILTPCYNMEKYIFRLLDSVLSQTYPFIEMIVIDDGSTDKSAQVVKRYISLFEKRGYILQYIYQPNSGQSVAIKRGLQLVSGEYLTWPDADDYYASSYAISRMVETLEQAKPEFAMVRTLRRVVDEDTGETLSIEGLNAHDEEPLSLFDDCLFASNGFYFCAGAYMVRFPVLRDATNLDIYTDKNAGQNWQLCLPVLYSYRCLTIKDIIYNVTARSDSHSRGLFSGYDRTISKLESYEATLHSTINRLRLMPENKKVYYNQLITNNYLREKMYLAFEYCKRDDYIQYYRLLSIGVPVMSGKDKLRYWSVLSNTTSILKFVLSIHYRIKNMLR